MNTKILNFSLTIPLSLFLLLLYLTTASSQQENQNSSKKILQPQFYQGIYLNNYSSRSKKKIEYFIKKAKKFGINAFVMDVQRNKGKKVKGRVQKQISMVSKKIVQKVRENGIWPIARVVVFDQGFYKKPSESLIATRINTAKMAAENGFREIQFDYIRFADNSGIKVPLKERYALIEGFLARAREAVKSYGVKISADVYGRIPLNHSDLIGQRMEGLAKVVDIIYPMAYPSHYTWSKKLMADPHYTVFITSSKGKKRVQGQAEIVSWIQGFKLRTGYARMSLPDYILAQIKATQKAGIRGYVVWNAAQRYNPTWAALQKYKR